MPIRVYATGTGGFQYQTMNIDIGDVFTMADLAGLIEAVPNGPGAVARQAGQDQLITSNLERVMTSYSERQIQNIFNIGSMALMERPGPLQMSFVFRNGNVFWADDTAHRTFPLTNSVQNPAWHIANRIQPALERAEMQTYGVLASLAAVFSNFSLHEALPGASQNRNPDRPTTYRGDRRLNLEISC